MDAQATQQDLIAGVAAELGLDGIEEIGRGGFGVVYRCAQPELDRLVAVKMLTADLDPDNLERFLREQRAMGRLSAHPHITTVLQAGTARSGRPFIVMPYHGKGSLWTRISRQGPLAWPETLGIGVKLAGALEAAHHAGILHRDVKPGNILLTDYDEPQVTDFGLARMAGGFETRAGVLIGSPAFIAPELLEGVAPTTTSDVYSLGATLFCAVTGHPPRGRSIPDELREQGLPNDVVAVFERAMARDPAERLTSAAGYGEQLRDIQRRYRLTVDEMVLPVDVKVELAGSVQTVSSANWADSAQAPSAIPQAPVTKYRPPGSVQSLVVRERLMAILRAAGRRRLILIHSPSGYGKTTLVAQWRAELADSGVSVCWLTVDDDDNNVLWFVAHVLEAIQRVLPAITGTLGRLLEQRGNEAARHVLASLIDEIEQNPDPITLVIDDWQRVSDSQTIDALRFLIDRGGEHLQIIVTSWSRAGLSLSRLRLRDELVEIDCAKLRFDAGEAHSLLNDVAGLQVADNDVAALTASTDGWVAALQLATLSLRGGDDAGSLLNQMPGDNEAVGEFLAENVLDALAPELLDFMLATSITERTCGELASVLAGVSGGQAALEDIERRGLFLRRIEDAPQWFRYHQMFAGFLRRRLERDDPDRFKDLHRAASAWFAERDYFRDAVEHALAAGETTRAIDLVEQDRALALVNQARVTTFLATIEKIPAQLVTSRPGLHLAVAWANILLQRPAATEAALDRFTAAISRADLPEERRADLTVEANVLRAVAQMNADRVEALADLVAEAIARPDTLRPILPQAAATVSAFAAIYRFDFEAAHRALEWSAPYDERLVVGAAYHSCWAGLAARYQLDIPRALQSFRKAFEIGTAVGRESQAARHAGSLLGELLYETGEFAEAAELLDEAYQLGPEAGAVDYLAAQYAVSARIKAAQGNRDAAVSRLDDGMAVAEKLGLPRLAAALTHERVRLGLPVTAADAARLRAQRSIPHDGNGVATITAELDEASGIRLLARGHASEDREQACRRAGALLAGIDPTVRPLAALQARLLLAQTLTAAGRAADAHDDIEAVRALCAQHGLPQLLVDAGLN